MPAKNERGMLTTRAQGQLMTKKVRALYTHVPKVIPPPIRRMMTGGIMARASAEYTTAGVYIRANFVMKFSDFDFLEPASSMSSNTLEAVESPNSLVVFTVIIFRSYVISIILKALE